MEGWDINWKWRIYKRTGTTGELKNKNPLHIHISYKIRKQGESDNTNFMNAKR